MKACPFCNSGEVRTQPYTEDEVHLPNGIEANFRVICTICYAEGPPARTREMAIQKWDGILADTTDDNEFRRLLNEMDGGGATGGVSSPMATLANTPGTGSAVPAQTAAMTGAQQTSPDAIGSGDKWGGDDIYDQNGKLKKKKKKKKKTNESNLNPYDKIGAMMAKKMGVPQPFKKKDSRMNTITQHQWEELDEDQPDNTQSIDDYIKNPNKVMNNARKRKVNEVSKIPYKIETLDDYQKASRHVPDHPLTSIKKKNVIKVNETTVRDDIALKDVKAKEELKNLGIAFEFKPAKSGVDRAFIKEPIKDVLTKIEQSEWEEYGKNSENTIHKWSKGDDILTIYAEGKDLPRATVTLKQEEEVAESIKIKKVVPNSLTPYIKNI